LVALDEFTVDHSIAFDFDSLLDCRFHHLSLLLLRDEGKTNMALPESALQPLAVLRQPMVLQASVEPAASNP